MAAFSTKDKRPRAKGAAVNAALMNTLLQHRHYLLQVEAGMLAKMRPIFESALKEIKARMAAGYSGYYANLARDLEGLIDAAVLDAQGRLTETLEALAPAEYATAGKILSSTLPGPLALRLVLGPPSLAHLQQMVNTPLGGVNYFDRLRTIRRESIRDVVDALAMAITLGEGMADATWRVMRAVEQIEYREAHTLARTEIQRVANEANKAVYDANSDMLSGIQWCATLDPATCLECAELDMSVWFYAPQGDERSVADAPSIPLHPRCRCVWLPVVKSWGDLGFTDQDLASFPEIKDLDGKLYGGYAYGDWFADQSKSVQLQILGPNRWADWDAGSLLLPSIAAAMPAGRVVGIDPSLMSDLLGMGDED